MKNLCLITLILVSFLDVSSQPARNIILKLTHDPRENAFTVLVPQGWMCEGGIYRIDPSMAGGSGNAIDAKNDFTIKRDASGTAMMRWLPDYFYFDMSGSPAGQMGLFPMGSNYNGMTVLPKMNAQTFIFQVVIPYVHPGMVNYQVIDRKNIPRLAELLRSIDQAGGLNCMYDAAVVTITFMEKNIQYQETYVSAIQDFGQLGAGLWKNRYTLFARAPRSEYASWDPLFQEIQSSVKINMTWLMKEMQGQVRRGEIAAETLRTLQQMDKEITQSRQKINAEINNDMFLTLTSQEEYVNPYTSEVEVGSNQWKHRWVNQSGDVIYSDDDNYNPDLDPVLNRSDFRKTPVRKR